VEQGCKRKHKAAQQVYLGYNHKPKSGPLFDIMKESKKELKYALRACGKSEKMPRRRHG